MCNGIFCKPVAWQRRTGEIVTRADLRIYERFKLILMNTTPNENLKESKPSRSKLMYLVSPVVLVMLMLGSRYRILGLDELPYAIGYYLSKFFHWLF